MGLYTDRGYDLETAKNACAAEIESWFGGATLDVFDSSAIGAAHRYYCSEADQLRMVNGRVANTSVALMCGLVPADPLIDPVFDWKTHTAAEAGKVHTDYVQFTKAASLQYQALKAQLAAATTVEMVEAVLEQTL